MSIWCNQVSQPSNPNADTDSADPEWQPDTEAKSEPMLPVSSARPQISASRRTELNRMLKLPPAAKVKELTPAERAEVRARFEAVRVAVHKAPLVDSDGDDDSDAEFDENAGKSGRGLRRARTKRTERMRRQPRRESGKQRPKESDARRLIRE